MAETGKTNTAPSTTTARVDSVKPPPDLPDTGPFERMKELTRRVVNVPKAEAVPPKKRRRGR